ncbi:MAG: bifunctional folylpolyglutamate synthase/dihydrofolate synthase [Candidatus Zixiibacteriota bacterium]|nr:MAG: bifunctional folylpolyglutamate synthase/dihydrofolate synthase [candidate division Zixibacteria bacterium]
MRRHTYASAERYILSREFFGMKLGLENITAFLESIGSPQTKYKTIHIAGTNGKGSTAAMLASIYHAQGYKTGLFTSPHLVSLRERVRVDGRMIPKRSVVSFVDRYRKVLSERKLSFFELITAMALEHFARTRVDIAVVETGLGGRLDASNVLSPELTITTDISRDHLEILGYTIPKIAREKAGIIKSSVPHLIGLLPLSAEKVIRTTCKEVGAPFFKLHKSNFVVYPNEMSLNFQYNGLAIRKVKPSLPGPHQLKNTALVLKAVSVLRERGLRVGKRAISEGISRTDWPGRFQIIRRSNLPTHVFDVCHNAAGIESFVDTIQKTFPGRKAKVITGFVKRKQHQKMFNSLSRIAESYALVPLRSGRSSNLGELIDRIDFRGVPLRRYGSLRGAYSKTLRNCDPRDVVAIIGSHFLVGEFFEKYQVK